MKAKGGVSRAASVLIATMLAVCVLAPAAIAQQRALPRAGFGNYSGADPGSLPGAGGVHLNEGMDRRGNGAEVYNPGEEKLAMKLIRWDQRHLPLKVWISPGKKLPEEPFNELTANRPDEVKELLLTNPRGFFALPQAPGWTPLMGQAAMNGIEQWKELQSEGVIAFEFVDNPALAQIMVFWVDRFIDAAGPGGNSVHGNTCATAFDVQAVRNAESRNGKPAQGSPVVIELRINPDTEKLQGDSAHEFGHALGIKSHSPYRQDIMYLNRIVSLLSPSDKATLRWLYRQPLQYVMLPPVVSAQLIQQAAAPAVQQEPPQRQQPEETATVLDNPGGRYKVSPLKKITDYGSPGGEVSPDSLENTSALPTRDPEPPAQRRKEPKQSRGKTRPVEERPTATQPDDFQAALDEIRGIPKKKEKKPVEQDKGKNKRKSSGESGGIDEDPIKNTVPENRPSDGY